MSGPGVGVGDRAPDFTLPGIEAGERRDFTLSAYRGRKVVLAFYPGDDTPSCTRQLCSYRDDERLRAPTGAVLLGISPQHVDSHERFAAARSLPFPLLADTDRAVARRYGIAAPLLGLRRAVFVLDEQGVVRWRNVKLVGISYVSPRLLDDVLAGI